MKLGTIVTVQERIATGHWKDATTRFYVWNAGFCYEGQPAISPDPKEYSRYGEMIGFYEVIHSSILAGTWEDFVRDILRIIRRRLVDDGYAKPAQEAFPNSPWMNQDDPVL